MLVPGKYLPSFETCTGEDEGGEEAVVVRDLMVSPLTNTAH